MLSKMSSTELMHKHKHEEVSKCTDEPMSDDEAVGRPQKRPDLLRAMAHNVALCLILGVAVNRRSSLSGRVYTQDQLQQLHAI